MKPQWHSFAVALALLVFHCRVVAAEPDSPKLQAAKAGYQSLLALFPEDSQGRGIDNFQPDRVSDQPMTYGLVLSAEAIRFKKFPTHEGSRRIHKAAEWLVQNSDLDHDGIPGWGLPQPWDAFADGTTNGPNHPYTITTAIVLNGLLDALSVRDFGTKAERQEAQALIKQVILHWCRDLWAEGFGGGFFWYSPCPCDANFSVNAPAMFLGSMSRFLREQGDIANPEERKFIESRADDLAKAIVNTVKMREGAPYWLYLPMPNRYNRRSPNDLVHQVYTLWGIEVYRDCGGRVKLPWTRKQAIESVDRYLHDGRVFSLAKDEIPNSNQKSVLWGTGSMLAFYGKWGSKGQASHAFEALVREHGPLPSLRLYPRDSSKDDKFFPRQAVHALWGMAYYCFGQEN